MKIFLSFLIITLFFIPEKGFSAPSCNKLIEIFNNNHSNIKLKDVRNLMNNCLIEANDDDYIDSPVSDYNDDNRSFNSANNNQNLSCRNQNSRNFVLNKNIKIGKVKVREKTSTKDLTNFMKDNGQNYDRGFLKFHTQGLMFSSLGFKIRPQIMSLSSFQMPNRFEFCQYISNIDYEMGYDDLLVYISRDTRKQSCDYYFTLRHELIHASISREVLLKYVPIAEEQIKKTFQNNNFYYQVVSAQNQFNNQAFMSMVSDKINNEILMPIQEVMTKEAKDKNDLFDYEEFKFRTERINYFCSN